MTSLSDLGLMLLSSFSPSPFLGRRCHSEGDLKDAFAIIAGRRIGSDDLLHLGTLPGVIALPSAECWEGKSSFAG